MPPGLLLTTLLSGFGLAFLHTLIPVHWLPFALAGRARNWSLGRTLAVNLAGGIGHVTVTALLGALTVFVGVYVDGLVEGVFPWIAAGLLILVGLGFLWRQWRGHRHAHGHGPDVASLRSDRAATVALIALLLFSPCEAFVPVYLLGATAGWQGFLLLTSVLAVATLSCMLAMTALVWRGLASERLAWVERSEAGVVGAVLILLAIILLIWQG